MNSSRRPKAAFPGWVWIVPGLLLGIAVSFHAARALPAWGNFAGNPQHTAVSGYASQPIQQIFWQAPVDLQPQLLFGSLSIHYGSPLVSSLNTVLVPVKTGVNDSFRVEARRGGDGMLLWQFDSDYKLPAHFWTPSFQPALTPAGRLYMPAAGGTILYADQVDTAGTPVFTRLAFYGLSNYNAARAAFNSDIQICTPITTNSQGTVYFGYRATGANPMVINGGIARITASGAASFVSASSATAGLATVVLMNCAPALSNDGQTLYLAIRTTAGPDGYLVALDAADLHTRSKVALKDPNSSNVAILSNNGTASVTVGPDGRVLFGVSENPRDSNNDRGWLLQFTPTLAPGGVPGSFGWDDTPSIVASSLVPSYGGSSSYLLMTKYNNYARGGAADGINRIAILDPNASQSDPHTGISVMQEVLTIAGVTPDSSEIIWSPNAVKEWCINSAVVDPSSHSVLAGSEDGVLYRWDLHTNSFSESVVLTPGVGEAYTPTMIGRDGRVYAINNSILFAVGSAVSGVGGPAHTSGPFLELPAPNPFFARTTLRFSLWSAGRAKLEVFDAEGRRVSTLLDAELAAGEHVAEWDGRDAGGRPRANGVYFARLAVGGKAVTRALVLTK